jgi:ArsR family transcriptional regulator, arsenate/arsenite/antimonite-responsive transcriptional repressor
MDKQLAELDRLLKALADPTRLRIVGLLRHGEVCVCHIHDSLGIPQPRASRHLAYLRKAGVVEADKRGLWVYYRLATHSAVTQALLDAVRHSATHTPTVVRDAKRLAKETGCAVETADASLAACCDKRGFHGAILTKRASDAPQRESTTTMTRATGRVAASATKPMTAGPARKPR